MKVSKLDKTMFTIFTVFQIGLLTVCLTLIDDIKHIIGYCTYLILTTLWVIIFNIEVK